MQIEETIRYSCNTRRERLLYIHHSSFSHVLFYFYFSLAKKNHPGSGLVYLVPTSYSGKVDASDQHREEDQWFKIE